MLTPWKDSYDQPRQHIKKQRHYLANKGLSSQSYGFSNSHVWMWELDYEDRWAPRNWCFWTVVEKTLESPLDCKEIQPVHAGGDQSWDFFGRTDAKAETPVLWPPHVKSWLIGKDLDPGRDLGQEERAMIEDEMAGWYHQLDGHEFEWTPGVGDGQGSLACCDSWGCQELDMTEWLNWTEPLLYSELLLMDLFAQAHAENRKNEHFDLDHRISFLKYRKEWKSVYGVNVERKIETIHHNSLHII